MSEIMLVKNAQGKLQGLTDDDEKAYQRFRKMAVRMEPGEMMKLSVISPRNAAFHRKYFALLNVGFEHWEPPRTRKTYKGMPIEKNRDRFREEVQILAGFYTQTFNLRGRLTLESKSISFAKMQQDEFEQLYNAVATVILEHVLLNYTRDDLDRVVNEVMGFL